MSPGAQNSVPLLERLSSRYLRSASGTAPPALDPIHVLNETEREGLRRVERGAVLRAALAGTANAILTGLGELVASRMLGPRPEHATMGELVSYYGVFGFLAVVFAIAEIAFLYWDGLRSVRALSLVAGLELHKEPNSEVATALARAALELPNPPDVTLGVDPTRESNKLELAIASAVYKLKISVTNFLFKAVVTRGLGRAATRGLLAFTAIPINSAWNGLVCWSVLREARLRVMGPSAATEMVEAAFVDHPEPSPALLAAAHQSVGSAVVRTQQLHPNHTALIRAFRKRFGEPPAGLEQDDSRGFLAALATLPPDEASVVLRMLAAAAILDGRLVRAERRLLDEAYRVARVSSRLSDVERLRSAFVQGDPIALELLRATG
ncbi:MAG TPA: hypothetical protein VH062_34240 [Polyangiaceae bacterium]|nr:hypothetical protein [Polyangiaceae bacterium]